MKNKLLLTSALVSGLIVGSDFATAQTTISGDLALHFRSQSYDTNVSSKRGIGRESQVNFANKGKLVNGMNYAAGFSLEFDGNTRTHTSGTQTMTGSEANSISNEGLFIDVELAPGSTVSLGVDRMVGVTREVPQVMGLIDNVAAGLGSHATNGVGANPRESIGLGFIQAIPGAGLTASINYVPQSGDFGSTDASVNAAGGRNSAYEYGFFGTDSFGVKGLGLSYFTNKEKKDTAASAADLEGTAYTVSYSTPVYTVGYQNHKQNRTTATGTAGTDMKAQQVSATFAATKAVTLGVSHMKNEKSGNAVEEKVTSLQVGYNLGPVALILSGSKADDLANTAGNDAKELAVRLTTKF